MQTGNAESGFPVCEIVLFLTEAELLTLNLVFLANKNEKDSRWDHNNKSASQET